MIAAPVEHLLDNPQASDVVVDHENPKACRELLVYHNFRSSSSGTGSTAALARAVAAGNGRANARLRHSLHGRHGSNVTPTKHTKTNSRSLTHSAIKPYSVPLKALYYVPLTVLKFTLSTVNCTRIC